MLIKGEISETDYYIKSLVIQAEYCVKKLITRGILAVPPETQLPVQFVNAQNLLLGYIA